MSRIAAGKTWRRPPVAPTLRGQPGRSAQHHGHEHQTEHPPDHVPRATLCHRDAHLTAETVAFLKTNAAGNPAALVHQIRTNRHPQARNNITPSSPLTSAFPPPFAVAVTRRALGRGLAGACGGGGLMSRIPVYCSSASDLKYSSIRSLNPEGTSSLPARNNSSLSPVTSRRSRYSNRFSSSSTNDCSRAISSTS